MIEIFSVIQCNQFVYRDSHVLTPKIIAFLFHLSKQRERPQMSIPKIINITDTLLANSVTKNGSVEALCQLAYEIYFVQTAEPDSEKEQTVLLNSEKESNTQKEVVFSMLLKFISELKVCELFSKFFNRIRICILTLLTIPGKKNDLHNFNEGKKRRKFEEHQIGAD